MTHRLRIAVIALILAGAFSASGAPACLAATPPPGHATHIAAPGWLPALSAALGWQLSQPGISLKGKHFGEQAQPRGTTGKRGRFLIEAGLGISPDGNH
jgi:hypothetical protein